MLHGVPGALQGRQRASRGYHVRFIGVSVEFSGNFQWVTLEFFGSVLWVSQGVSRGFRELLETQKISRSFQGYFSRSSGCFQGSQEVQGSFQWRFRMYRVVSRGVLRTLREIFRGSQGCSHEPSSEFHTVSEGISGISGEHPLGSQGEFEWFQGLPGAFQGCFLAFHGLSRGAP